MSRAARLGRFGKLILLRKANTTNICGNKLCSTRAIAETLTDTALPQTETNNQFKMFNPTEIVANATAQAEAEVYHLKSVDHVSSLMEEMLKMSRVRIGNPEEVKEKLIKMAFGGSSKLLVISDFDYTLSRFENEEGVRLSTTHGVFDDNVMKINPELGQKFIDLRDKYYPIEFCPNMEVEEKIPHMEKWWSTTHSLIVNEKFSKSMIEDFVRQSRIIFRDGAEELIETLDGRSIPLVIFSAGIGNIIEIFIQQKLGAIPKNTHFISNMILFDEDEKSCGFSEPLIHTFCKNSSVIQKETSFFHEISGRTNVILLGDSMGDIHMDVGVEKNGPTLKIGYYNGNIDDQKLLDHYTEVYDIVLIHDSTLNIAQQIIDLINAKSVLV